MTRRLPLSVQHEVPGFVGPLSIAALWLAISAGQFDTSNPRLLFPFVVVLLLPPVGRAVWSFIARRPVVTGALDQRLVGADLLLLTIALLQASRGTDSPLVLLLYAAACALGLSLGVRKIAPAVVLATSALLLGALRGALGGDGLGLCSVLLGLVGFALLPPLAISRVRDEVFEARETLRVIEKTAKHLGHDSSARQDRVRRASFAPEDVEAEIQALGLRAREWLATTCRALVSGTGADRCLIYRLDEEEGTLELQAYSGEASDVLSSVSRREGAFAVVFKTGVPLLMPSVSKPYGGLSYTDDPDAIGSFAVIPVMRGPEELWGAIVLDAPDQVSVTEKDPELVSGVAPLLVTLFDQLADLTAYRRGSSEDKMLHETSQVLAEQDNLDDLSRVLVERTTEMVGAQAGALALLREDSSLEVIRAIGFDPDPDGIHFPFDKTASLLAQSIRYSHTITQTGLGSDRREALLFGAEYGPSEGFTDVMVMPLLKPGATERVCLGAVCLCRDGNRPFGGDEESRAEMLSNQAASHIMNIWLLEDSRTQASTDGLTGLPNRRAFVEKLNEMLHRGARFGTPVSLLILDTDHFKNVNDTYGHPVGDQVLRRLAGLLSDSVREAVDMAARYGGEEFAVLLENTPHDGALKLAERLRSALEAETFIHIEGSQAIQFHVTMSIGVASYPESGDAMVLVGKADEALYEAKQSGRNRVISAHGVGTP